MTTATLDSQSGLQLSASTLEQYAASAGRKYAKICHRISQAVKSVPAFDKAIQKVQDFDKKMTEEHGKAYKFAKGAVIGTAVGVGLIAAGAEVATAYAAVNVVRTVGGLLGEAEKARLKGQANGFADYLSKNKLSGGLTALSIGMSAAGISAGVIENSTVVSAISMARQASIGGIMATSTAAKLLKIRSAEKNGEITKEQAKKARIEQYAEFAGKLISWGAVTEAGNIATEMHTDTGHSVSTDSHTAAPASHDAATVQHDVPAVQHDAATVQHDESTVLHNMMSPSSAQAQPTTETGALQADASGFEIAPDGGDVPSPVETEATSVKLAAANAAAFQSPFTSAPRFAYAVDTTAPASFTYDDNKTFVDEKDFSASTSQDIRYTDYTGSKATYSHVQNTDEYSGQVTASFSNDPAEMHAPHVKAPAGLQNKLTAVANAHNNASVSRQPAASNKIPTAAIVARQGNAR